MPEIMGHRINRIQDDGKKFILHGNGMLASDLEKAFDQIGLGISVTKSHKGNVHILYTENNRDIVLQILKDHVTGK